MRVTCHGTQPCFPSLWLALLGTLSSEFGAAKPSDSQVLPPPFGDYREQTVLLVVPSIESLTASQMLSFPLLVTSREKVVAICLGLCIREC